MRVQTGRPIARVAAKAEFSKDSVIPIRPSRKGEYPYSDRRFLQPLCQIIESVKDTLQVLWPSLEPSPEVEARMASLCLTMHLIRERQPRLPHRPALKC